MPTTTIEQIIESSSKSAGDVTAWASNITAGGRGKAVARELSLSGQALTNLQQQINNTRRSIGALASIISSTPAAATLPYVTPQDFGAQGDGVSDDTVAVQKAFDDGRAVALFSNSTYLCTNLTLRSDLTVFGMAGAVLKQVDGAAVDDTPFISGSGITSVYLNGVKIDGNRDNQPGVTNVCGLFLDDVTGVVLQDCETTNTSGCGVGGLLWKNVDIRNHKASAWGIGNDYGAIYLQNGTFAVLPTGDSYNILIQGCSLDGTDSGSGVKLTATATAPLSGVRISDNDIYVGYPTGGFLDALGIEVWSGPSGVGGNSFSDIVIADNRIDSQFDSSGPYPYGRSWGISLSQGTDVTVTGNQIKNCGVYGIELIGSRMVCDGNECINCGVISVIVSSSMASQSKVVVNNNMNVTRVGDQYGATPMAGISVYIEATGDFTDLQICGNDITTQGDQRGIWLQANGSGAISNGIVSANVINGDSTAGAWGIVLAPDGLGSQVDEIICESNRFQNLDVAIQNGATNARFLWNIFGSGVATRYGGSFDATCMIVDVSGPEGINFAPPSVQIRGRAHTVVGDTGDLFLDEANDRARFATADDGVDANPNVVNYERVNFGTELQGGYVAVNSRWDGDPDWIQTSAHSYTRAMYMQLGAARWAIRFGDATNTDSSEPGEVALQAIDGNNTGGEPQRVATGANFPFFVQGFGGQYAGSGDPEGSVTASSGAIYQRTNGVFYVKVSGTGNTGWKAVITASIISRGSGSPETVVTADVGTLYLQTNGATGAVLWVKETGSGNTGWVSDGGTIWRTVGTSKFRTDNAIGLGKDPGSVGLDVSGAVIFDSTLAMSALTASLPLKLNASKQLTAAKIDIGSSSDISGTGLSSNQILQWSGSAVAGVSGVDATVTEITSGPTGASFVDGVSLSGTVPAGLTLTVSTSTAVTGFGVTSHTVTKGVVTS